MDQSDAPLLNALADYRDKNRYGFTPPGHRQGRRQRQIRGDAQGGVPTVRHEQDAVFVGHPADAPTLAQPAALGHVRLDVVHGAALDPGEEGLAAREDLAARDRDRGVLRQLDVAFQVIRAQRFLEPGAGRGAIVQVPADEGQVDQEPGQRRAE